VELVFTCILLDVPSAVLRILMPPTVVVITPYGVINQLINYRLPPLPVTAQSPWPDCVQMASAHDWRVDRRHGSAENPLCS
jgi:hypothetical protein